MNAIPTELPEVLIVAVDVHQDERGFFFEAYQHRSFARLGIGEPFVQDNHSHSTKGVLRGLHYQLQNPQGKLVRVVRGEIWDVAVDIRKGSPRFGQWTAVALSEENKRQLYVPPGFAHGFCVLSDVADVIYKCTDFYAPGDEYGVRWDDPSIGIDWPQMEPLLSKKDRAYPWLRDMERALPVYSPE
nr:dTDP-4-dehydrorhamnose 3,5-epimerase [Gammaproteobacteria bacterium]